MALLTKYGKDRVFSDLYEDENYDLTLYIPAAVVMCEEKMSKNGNIFYNLTLMDKTGSLLNLRSFHKPAVSEGEFAIKRNVTSGYENITCSKEFAFKNQEKKVEPINKSNLNQVTPQMITLPDGTPFTFGVKKEDVPVQEEENDKEEKERE